MLMTPEDAAEYLGVSQTRVTELRTGWTVAGVYAPARGAVVPLYSRDDVISRCPDGHLLPPRRTRCKACKFERQLVRMAR